jgi:hypothetical protein
MVQPYLDQLRELPFVVDVAFLPASAGLDGTLTVSTPAGSFRFAVELKTSFLDKALTNAIAALSARLAQHQNQRLLLLARYVPRPTGERLIAAGVNFVDLAGNMHLALGENYTRTILGRSEPVRSGQGRLLSPAVVQVLFTFACHPESANWPVRELAPAAGVSKSKAADARRQLLSDGTLQGVAGERRLRDPKILRERLLTGYTQVLRPRLLVNRFRSQERNPEEFIRRLPRRLEATGMKFALTGGPAADLLQHYYLGAEVPLFLSETSPAVFQKLRLLPDQSGSVVVLRAFGAPVFWRTVRQMPVAHPWLIYAELMDSADPRGHDAAEELRREFLEQ